MPAIHPQQNLGRRTLGLALVVLAAASLVGCKKHADSDHLAKASGEEHEQVSGEAAKAEEVRLTADAVERYGVKLAEAQLWVLRPTFIAPARVAFNTEAVAHVGAPLRGRAVDVMVRLGDQVKKGDALVVVESPDLGEAQADFLQKRTARETVASQVDLAKSAWERGKGLYEQSQGVSLTEVQRREGEYRAAVAAVKAAEAAAGAAENRLQILGMDRPAIDTLAKSGDILPRYTVHAPIDGQVVQRDVTLGELVNPDRESLLVLADTRTLWVLADIPEARLPQVAAGAKAWVSIGQTAPPTQSQKYEGAVAFISPVVDAATRTAQVRIEVPASALPLRPGMFVQVELLATVPGGADPEPTIAVPLEAVQTIEGSPVLFVPVTGEENTFAKRIITTGKPVGQLIPIYAGLVEGEKFVTSGTFILKADLGKSSAKEE